MYRVAGHLVIGVFPGAPSDMLEGVLPQTPLSSRRDSTIDFWSVIGTMVQQFSSLMNGKITEAASMPSSWSRHAVILRSSSVNRGSPPIPLMTSKSPGCQLFFSRSSQT